MLLPSGLIRPLYTRGQFRFRGWGADVVAHFDDLANKNYWGFDSADFQVTDKSDSSIAHECLWRRRRGGCQ